MRRFVPVAGALSVLVLLAAAVVVSIDPSNFRAETIRPATHPFRTASWVKADGNGAARASFAPKPHLVKSYGNLPLSFEANQGQTDGQVKFLSRGKGYGLFLTGSEAVLTLSPGKQKAKGKEQKAKVEDSFALLRPSFASPAPSLPAQAGTQTPAPAVLRMKVVGANTRAAVKGLDQLPGHSNYYIGNDPKKWRTNVPSYAKVKYEGVYPGVDLVYYGNQRQLEYDFVVAPGADPSTIALAFETGNSKLEAGKAKIDARGDLVIATEAGEVRFHKPVVYQLENPKSQIQNRKSVEGRFKLLAANRVGFEVDAYDRTKPLVIDPALNYATYLGGDSFDFASAIAADSAGNAYVTGFTGSTNFPESGTAPGGVTDAFFTKLNPAGTARVFSTYLGGTTGTEEAYGIALDAPTNPNIYLTGDTYSTDFPGITAGGDLDKGDVFVTKLTNSGTLVFSKLLHGSGYDVGQGIKADSAGNTYIVGSTTSDDFMGTVPSSVGFQSACSSCGGGLYDAFVAKLDPTGAPLYASFLGGTDADSGASIAVDPTSAGKKVWVIGSTSSSTGFPTKNAPFPNYGGGSEDAFVAEFDPTASGEPSLLFSTYLGDVSDDAGRGIAVDSLGKVYIAGFTDFGSKYTATDGYVSVPTPPSLLDVFIGKVDPTTATFVYADLIGGAQDDDVAVAGIAVDSAGNAYVTGTTYSSDFPASAGTFNTSGAGDTYVLQIPPDGLTAPTFSTLLGGEGQDISSAIAVTPSGQIFVAGITDSSDFPASTGAVQPACGDTAGSGCTEFVGDGFVASYGAPVVGGPTISLDPTSVDFGNQLVGSTSAAQTVTVHNTSTTDALTINGITVTGASAFAQTNNCGTSVAAGGSCTISATFAPTETGGAEGSIRVDSTASNGPINSVGLAGNGVDFSITPGEGSSTTATVAAGATATYNLSALGTAGVTGNASLSCSGAPTAATCAVNPTTITLSDTTAANFTVSVTTTARSLVAPMALKVPPVSGWKAPVAQPVQLAWLLALLAMAGMTLASRRRAKWLLAATMLVVLMWSACDNTKKTPPQTGTPAGTYTLTITATGAGGTKTTPLTLTVN